MMSQDRLEHLQSVMLSITLTLTGSVSTLDNIEQIGRITLIGISITSGIFLIIVNWAKVKHQIKEWVK